MKKIFLMVLITFLVTGFAYGKTVLYRDLIKAETIEADNICTWDTNISNKLWIRWNEDDSSDRTFNIKVNSGNRTIDLSEDLEVADGYNFTLLAEDAAGRITLDEQTLEIEGEGTATRLMKFINSADADATLTIEGTTLKLDGGTNTFIITAGTSTLEIVNGEISFETDFRVGGTGTTITGVTQANIFTLNEGFTIGNGHTGTLTYSAAGKILTVEDNTQVNQDLTTDADVGFNKVTSVDDLISGDDVILPATGKVLLDGAGGHTYIEQTSDDKVGITVGDTKLLELIEDTADTVKVNAQLNMNGAITGLQYFEFEADAGVVTAMDMPVSATPADGDEMSYVFRIDSNNILKVKALADHAGGVDEHQVIVYGDLSATTYSINANESVVIPSPGTLTNLQYAGARIITLTAGYGNTAIGDLVYLNNDDSKFELTDGNAAATAADVLVGVVLEVVAENASCKIMLEGTITVDAWNWTTVGASLFISGTAGDFTQTRLAVANDIVRIMGCALDDDTIYFCPDNAYATVE